LRRIFPYIVLLLLACNPSASLIKKAHEYELKELYDDACTYYYNALLVQPDNIKAKEGLRLTGQKVLNEKFNLFSKLVLQNKVTDAVKEYLYAQKFYENAKQVGVTLDWLEEYDEVYLEVKAEYADRLFDEALVMINQKRFEEAEKQFELIAAVDTTYAGISLLRINTLLEAIYRQAEKLMQDGKYKEAVSAWNRLLQMDANYRDVVKQKQLAIDLATTRVGLFPIVGLAQEDIGFERAIDQQLAKSNSTFVKIFASSDIAANLESKGWGNNLKLTDALNAAKSIGLSLLIRIELIGNTDTSEQVTSAPREAYEAYTESVLNPYSNTFTYITRFKKIDYTDTYQSIKLTYTYRYAIYNIQTGTLVSKDEITLYKQDEVHEFSYKGDASKLYQQLPIGNYLPPEDPIWRSQFSKSKRPLMSKQDLQREAQKEFAFIISYAVNKSLK
jgi:tetratricopeptide (TPR) repeat protein